MLHKSGKWFADWRDAQGRRRRKAFDSKPAALRYQARQRAEVLTKKVHGSAPSATSPQPGRNAGRAAATGRTPPVRSSRSPARSKRTS